MKKIKRYFLPLLIITILSSFLVSDSLFHRGIFTAHDIETNIIYFGAFYSSLTEGNLIPRWSANLANLYGSPTSMFFYPFSYYLTSFIRVMGFSLQDSMKIFIFITFILSAVFMYLWLRKHLSKLPAVLGSFLYVYAPYRINDIFARGSVAENTAFVFIPLLALTLYSLFEKPTVKKIILLSLCLSGFVLSHPFMLIVFTPFYFLYLIYLGINLKKIIHLFIAGILSLLSTAFYVIPLLFENKYTHYDISPFNGSGYATQFLNFKKLILPVWTFIDVKGQLEYQTYQIGILQIALFLISILILIWFFIKNKREFIENKIIRFSLLGLVCFVISVFFMLPISDFVYKSFPQLQQIEFPWRFLALNLFSLIILFVPLFSLINKRIQLLIFFIIILVAMYLYLPYSKGHGYKEIPDSYYLYDIKENTDGFATLPKWASQPDKYPRINNRYEIIEGEAIITLLKRNSTEHIYQVVVISDTRFADSTFYFPGWTVLLNSKPIPVEFQDPNYRGIITFNIPKGQHLVEVVFRDTKVRQFADLISLFGLILTIIIYIYATKLEKSINYYTRL